MFREIQIRGVDHDNKVIFKIAGSGFYIIMRKKTLFWRDYEIYGIVFDDIFDLSDFGIGGIKGNDEFPDILKTVGNFFIRRQKSELAGLLKTFSRDLHVLFHLLKNKYKAKAEATASPFQALLKVISILLAFFDLF
jgi:hypothetical protein